MARTQSNENLAAGISLFFRFLQILAAFFCSARDDIWLSGRIYWSVSSQSSQDKSLSQRLHGLDVYSSFFRYFCLFYLNLFRMRGLNHRDRSIQLYTATISMTWTKDTASAEDKKRREKKPSTRKDLNPQSLGYEACAPPLRYMYTDQPWLGWLSKNDLGTL